MGIIRLPHGTVNTEDMKEDAYKKYKDAGKKFRNKEISNREYIKILLEVEDMMKEDPGSSNNDRY